MKENRVQELCNALNDRVQSISRKDEETFLMQEIFEDALSKTMEEIHFGADSRDFTELTIINFIILSDKKGVTSESIKEFLQLLK